MIGGGRVLLCTAHTGHTWDMGVGGWCVGGVMKALFLEGGGGQMGLFEGTAPRVMVTLLFFIVLTLLGPFSIIR